MATSQRARLELQLAVAAERIRGLEAQVVMLEKALHASVSGPAVMYGSDATNPTGPGFALLAQQAMANADVAELPKPPVDVTPKIYWLKADGTDPAIVAEEGMSA